MSLFADHFSNAIFLNVIFVFCKISNIHAILELDLNPILQPFEHCIVIIHDFNPDKNTNYLTLHENKIPIILSDFVLNPYNYSFDVEFLNPQLFINKSRPININCAIELFIKPPLRQGLISFESVLKFLTLPKKFGVDSYELTIYNYYFAVYKAFHFKYNMMLTTENDTNLWDNWIGPFAQKRSVIYSDDAVSDFLIGTISDNQNEQRIEKVFIVCEFCNLHNRTYLTIKLEDLSINNLVEESKNIGKQFSKVEIKWNLRHANWDEGKIVSILNRTTSNFSLKDLNRETIRKLDLDLLLWKIVFPNGSQFIKNSSFDSSYYEPKDTIKIPSKPRLYLGNPGSPFLSLGPEQIEFITCHSLDGGRKLINLSRVFASFDGYSWILIAFGMSTFSGGLILVTYSTNSNKKHPDFIRICLFGFGTLLEQGNAVAKNKTTNKLFRKNVAYWICGSWIIFCIVVTNCYKGQVVKLLTVPVEPNRYTRFEQLVAENFTLFTRPYSLQGFATYLQFYDKYSDKEWRETMKSFVLVNVFLMPWIYTPTPENEKQPTKNKVQLTSKYINSIQQISTIPRNILNITDKTARFVDLISNCQEKTAFVSWTNEINENLHQLENLLDLEIHTISRSVEAPLKMTKGWSMSNWGSSVVISRLTTGIVESGLGLKFHKTFNQDFYNVGKKKQEKSGPRALSIHSNNVLVVFFILFCGTLFSVTLLLLEFFRASGLAKSFILKSRNKVDYVFNVEIAIQPVEN